MFTAEVHDQKCADIKTNVQLYIILSPTISSAFTIKNRLDIKPTQSCSKNSQSSLLNIIQIIEITKNDISEEK